MKWRDLFLLVVISICPYFISEVHAIEPKVTKVFDKDSGLECQMEMLGDKDNGVYGLLVGIKNFNKKDVVLKIPAELLEFAMISLVTDKGELISRPPKVYTVDGKELQKIIEVVIPKLSAHEWFIPIREYIQHRESLRNGVKVRTSLLLVLSYKFVDRDKKAGKDFKMADINVIDKDSLFTSQALEGDPYEMFKNRDGVIRHKGPVIK